MVQENQTNTCNSHWKLLYCKFYINKYLFSINIQPIFAMWEHVAIGMQQQLYTKGISL